MYNIEYIVAMKALRGERQLQCEVARSFLWCWRAKPRLVTPFLVPPVLVVGALTRLEVFLYDFITCLLTVEHISIVIYIQGQSLTFFPL